MTALGIEFNAEKTIENCALSEYGGSKLNATSPAYEGRFGYDYECFFD